MNNKIVLNLGKIDYNDSGRKNCMVTLEVELKPAQNVSPHLTVDLEPIPADAIELSICGNVWNPRHTDLLSGGQDYETIEEHFSHDPRVMRLIAIWKEYHLNGMKAGTRAQDAALKEMPQVVVHKKDLYTEKCEFLKALDLYEVTIPQAVRANFDYKKDKAGNLPTHYQYGHAWLFAVIPQAIIDEVRQLCKDPAFERRPAAPYESANLPESAKDEVDDSMYGFCTSHGIAMKATQVAENPNREDDGKWEADHWRCVFSMGKKTFTTYYSMGLGHNGKKPTREEVLNCLVSDSRSNDTDFESWCGELGFESDSRAHEKIYHTCVAQAKKLKKFLGEELFAEIMDQELA